MIMKPSKYSVHAETEEKKRHMYIASIAQALNHLSDQWIAAVQRGQIDIQLAVHIGHFLQQGEKNYSAQSLLVIFLKCCRLPGSLL